MAAIPPQVKAGLQGFQFDRMMSGFRSLVDQGASHVDTDNNTASRIAIYQRVNNDGKEGQQFRRG